MSCHYKTAHGEGSREMGLSDHEGAGKNSQSQHKSWSLAPIEPTSPSAPSFLRDIYPVPSNLKGEIRFLRPFCAQNLPTIQKNFGVARKAVAERKVLRACAQRCMECGMSCVEGDNGFLFAEFITGNLEGSKASQTDSWCTVAPEVNKTQGALLSRIVSIIAKIRPVPLLPIEPITLVLECLLCKSAMLRIRGDTKQLQKSICYAGCSMGKPSQISLMVKSRRAP